ncbi:DUF2306 domain-containing protein [Phenylobacterium terrae]|uniref:DUF2306 domain-containing protein n=1 Tax=Phenylobacterium terrae TaxID=2665495 RepID=A0ABW4N118_9CAUL
MNTTTSRAGGASLVLSGSAVLWVSVALIGQWAFVYYIAAFYGPATLAGEFAQWNRNKLLVHGHVAGDVAGNLVFASHVLLAALVTLSGTLQLLPQVRARAPAFHRWNGRLFLISGAAAAAGGLYLVFARGDLTRVMTWLPITLNAALILTSAALAWRTAVSRNIAAHRRWALRLFLVVNGVWFLRVGLIGAIVVNRALGGSLGPDGAPAKAWAFGSYLVPLAVLELYFWARSQRGWLAQGVTSAVLVLLTGVTAVGVAAVALILWRPLL